jgi:hypothetical protein
MSLKFVDIYEIDIKLRNGIKLEDDEIELIRKSLEAHFEMNVIMKKYIAKHIAKRVSNQS